VGHFVRTANRRDFSVDPTGRTMLDALKSSGYDVLAVGKIEDIFNHRGITQSNHVVGNQACCDATIEYMKKASIRLNMTPPTIINRRCHAGFERNS
jgi:phosphopentomutase